MKRRFWILIALAAVVVSVTGAYTWWNIANPVNTCARCHEIVPSQEEWLKSAHAEKNCTECHGTALSGGFRSMKEKTGMFLTHLKGNRRNEDIRLTEAQVLEVSNRCIACHQSEYAGWLASGHAVNYKEIFMDSAHNAAEKPYWDCLRCHGMFYEGNINTLMYLEGKPDEWKIIDKKQEKRAAVPCLACHRMHTENPVSERYVSMIDSSRFSIKKNPKTSFYMRSEKISLSSDFLTIVKMMDGEHEVKTAADPNTRLCMQCHAPSHTRQAGSGDDRTPTGVHEGISCIICHQPHSGKTQASCDLCHPAMSNCGVDVKTMNTTFNNPKSPNDIHRISCANCHNEKK